MAGVRTHTQSRQATHPPARSPTRSRPFIDPWQGLLGVERTGSYRSESENVDEVAVSLTLTLNPNPNPNPIPKPHGPEPTMAGSRSP